MYGLQGTGPPRAASVAKPRASRVVCRLHALVGRYLAIRDESCRRHRRSVFHTHTDHDENRIVLLLAALDWRHRSPWRNWKRSLLRVCRRARTTNRRRCVARGAAGQVCHVVERRAFIELPAPITILVGGMNGQHSRHLAVTRDQVFAGRERKGRLLHDQAVFLQPPVRAVEFPARRGDATCILQRFIAVQLDAPRTRVQRPQTPRLRAAPGGRTWITQRRDELRRYALELRLTSAKWVRTPIVLSSEIISRLSFQDGYATT